ncbi:hypothetical protein ACQUY5_31500 [Bacillus cereus]|uniref:hypothetical protein n=1 Tax=Bacillus cereus TaxID=1396 RepID=UPI003D16A434
MKLTKSFVSQARGIKHTLDADINHFITTNGFELLNIQYIVYRDANGNPIREALITYDNKLEQETRYNKKENLLPLFILNSDTKWLERFSKTIEEEIRDIKGMDKNGEKGKAYLWDKYGENLLFSHSELQLLIERYLEQEKEG